MQFQFCEHPIKELYFNFVLSVCVLCLVFVGSWVKSQRSVVVAFPSHNHLLCYSRTSRVWISWCFTSKSTFFQSCQDKGLCSRTQHYAGGSILTRDLLAPPPELGCSRTSTIYFTFPRMTGTNSPAAASFSNFDTNNDIYYAQ